MCREGEREEDEGQVGLRQGSPGKAAHFVGFSNRSCEKDVWIQQCYMCATALS